MTQSASTLRTTIAINAQLLFAFGLGWTSWALWPAKFEWLGMGVISVAVGLSAAAQLIKTLQLIFRVYQHDKAVHEFLAQGAAPKSSEMASISDLDKAGMR